MDQAARRPKYARIGTALALLDDEALLRLMPRSGRRGNTCTVEVAGESVFVKLIPLTDLERDRPYSTRNHYRLPTYYQYGVGSAGFGAWRELVTHVTTTNWVLEEAIATFPLTYHFRVVRRPHLTEPFIEKGLDEYVRYWNSSKNIGRYMGERASGSHAALIFLEHLPHSMWDSRFDLTTRAFLGRHTDFDYGSIVFSVAPQLALWFAALPEAEQATVRDRLGMVDDRVPVQLALVRGAEQLDGLAPPELLGAAGVNAS